MIQRVGRKVEAGFCVTDGLANWTVSAEELFSGSWIPWLQRQTDHQSPVVQTCTATGAEFSDLEAGVYLVQQKTALEGYLQISPFLLCIPQEDVWQVTREVKLLRDSESPRTGDRHVPLIGAMIVGFSVALLMVLVDQRNK